MDYEKKLALAKEALDSGSYDKETIEYIFPELQETNDERIRKVLIDMFKGYNIQKVGDFTDKEIIAWLEKQGDKDKFIEKELGCIKGYRENAIKRLEELEKRGEPTDKVEPKFKVGDWIIGDKDNTVHQVKTAIENVSNGKYAYDLIDGGYISTSHESDYHLWTIQDAKDGDMLCYKDEISLYRHDIKNCTKQETTFGGFVYYCCYDGKRFVVDSLYSLTEQDKMDIHPATKEQRDQLEKAMADAGYRWNTDEKKMEKIEQKPAWSEKDDEMLDSIIEEVRYIGDFPDYPTKEENELYDECLAKVDWLKSLKDRLQQQHKQEWNEEDEKKLLCICAWIKDYPRIADFKDEMYTVANNYIDWLKSLRPQNGWKPNEEQIYALRSVVTELKHSDNKYQETIENLYNDLEKLREE